MANNWREQKLPGCNIYVATRSGSDPVIFGHGSREVKVYESGDIFFAHAFGDNRGVASMCVGMAQFSGDYQRTGEHIWSYSGSTDYATLTHYVKGRAIGDATTIKMATHPDGVEVTVQHKESGTRRYGVLTSFDLVCKLREIVAELTGRFANI